MLPGGWGLRSMSYLEVRKAREPQAARRVADEVGVLGGQAEADPGREAQAAEGAGPSFKTAIVAKTGELTGSQPP